MTNKFQIVNFKFKKHSVLLVLSLSLVVGVLVVLGKDYVRQSGLDGSIDHPEKLRNGAGRITEKIGNTERYREIIVDGEVLRVEVADEPREIERGLGYRDEIGSDGMLFVLPRRGVPSFWMKGMRFGLDMVWIDCGGSYKLQATSNKNDQECRVVDITEYVSVAEDAEKPREFYSPRVPVTHVLEVESGWVEESGIDVGDEVVID